MEERRLNHIIVLYNTCLIDSFNFQYFMVTGGQAGPSYTDITEVYIENVWVTVAAKLPYLVEGLSVATINNRVLSFGKLFIIWKK